MSESEATLDELFDSFAAAIGEAAQEELGVDVRLVVGVTPDAEHVIVASKDEDEKLAILLEELLARTRARLAQVEATASPEASLQAWREWYRANQSDLNDPDDIEAEKEP